jgi:uncharacterized protein (DUF1330 family)
MAKAYWIACYRKITDTAKLAAYAKLALPAIESGERQPPGPTRPGNWNAPC